MRTLSGKTLIQSALKKILYLITSLVWHRCIYCSPSQCFPTFWATTHISYYIKSNNIINHIYWHYIYSKLIDWACLVKHKADSLAGIEDRQTDTRSSSTAPNLSFSLFCLYSSPACKLTEWGTPWQQAAKNCPKIDQQSSTFSSRFCLNSVVSSCSCKVMSFPTAVELYGFLYICQMCQSCTPLVTRQQLSTIIPN